jgi:hypothetical protein
MFSGSCMCSGRCSFRDAERVLVLREEATAFAPRLGEVIKDAKQWWVVVVGGGSDSGNNSSGWW